MRISAEEFVASMPKRTAGWYEDPMRPSALRWWDGEEWTTQTDDQFRPLIATPSPQPPVRSAWAPAASSRRATSRVAVVRGIAALVLAGAVAAAAMAVHEYLVIVG